MKYRSGSMTRLATPLRALTERFAFVFLIVIAFGLMLLFKAETRFTESVRTGVSDAVTPIMDVMSRPAEAIAEMIEGANRLLALHQENERLRQENRRLMEWQAVARHLAAQNRSFRELLHYVPDAGARYVTARVIADAGGVFAQSKLINAGARDGVNRDSAVTTGSGLAGRIAAVGERSARVLLITDLNSRIPVVIESSRERAILAGDNRSQPKLVFLRPTASIRPGDRVVTSGHGGVFPPGLPVGVIASAEKGSIRVQPFVELEKLEYVRVVQFKAPALSDPW